MYILGTNTNAQVEETQMYGLLKGGIACCTAQTYTINSAVHNPLKQYGQTIAKALKYASERWQS